MSTGAELAKPKQTEIKTLLIEHLLEHYELYGELTGLYTARKHIGWYVRGMNGGEAFRAHMNQLETCEAQLQAVNDFFDGEVM